MQESNPPATDHENKDHVPILIPLESIHDKSINKDLEFSWSQVGFSVDIKKGKIKDKKILLSNNSGIAQGGQVIAILGGSGAGKSTLLNCLSGRLGPGELTGEILFNGSLRKKETWRTDCAFVEQDDIMYNNLTVQETLQFSALLRLPNSMGKLEKMQRVEKVIMDLGLNGCRHVVIGNSENKGISGGERKRLAIGMELMTEPDLLFLDEPTSGLDAFTAFNIISTIKEIAHKQNRIVILTIHQPRTDILKLFDKILLLSTGKTVFYGSTFEALDHFESLGFPIPSNTNPSDFFLDITTLDQRTESLLKESSGRIQVFIDAWNSKMSDLQLPVKSDDSLKGKGSSVAKPSFSWWNEFYVLLKRNMLDVVRDVATLGATIGQAVIITIILGAIFWQMPLNQAGVQNRIGVFFFLCINLTFGNVMPTIGVFPEQRQIIKRERASGSYRPSSAYLAKFVSSLPLVIAGALLMAIPLYWMLGLTNDEAQYFTFICITVVHALAANAMGLMISSFVPNARVGQILGPLIIIVFLLFGGQLVNLDTVSPAFRWIQWLSIITYSNKAYNQNEFVGLTFSCNGPSTQCYTTGQQVLEAFGLMNPTLWYCVLINGCLCFAFVFLGFVFFSRTSAPLLRLE